MTKRKLTERYNKQLDSFREYLAKTIEKQGTEEIHQLRVSIKKIRALLTLMEIAGKHQFNKDEHFALFSDVFSNAGKVREAQINLGLLSKYKATDLISYSEYLVSEEQENTLKLNEKMKVFDFTRLKELDEDALERMKKVTDDVISKEAALLVLDKLKKVKKLTHKNVNDDQLHKIRIHLKAVSEVLELLHELKPAYITNRLQHAFKSLNKSIGKWHDYKVLNSSLKDFIRGHSKDSNIKHLKKIKKQVKTQSEKMRKKTYQSLSACLE